MVQQHRIFTGNNEIFSDKRSQFTKKKHEGGANAPVGRRPLTRALFGRNVCENEITGSRWVGGLDPPLKI